MTRKRNLLTASWTTAVCLVLSAADASAAARSATDAEARRADFSGRWVPDFERWQGVERLLDLQDAPWVVRQAIGRVRAVEAVTQTGEELVVELDVPLPLPGKVQRCPFDDRLRDDQTPLGRPSRSRHHWEDSRTRVHVHELEDENRTPYTLTARHRLGPDGDTMYIEIMAAVPQQPDHRALCIAARQIDGSSAQGASRLSNEPAWNPSHDRSHLRSALAGSRSKPLPLLSDLAAGRARLPHSDLGVLRRLSIRRRADGSEGPRGLLLERDASDDDECDDRRHPEHAARCRANPSEAREGRRAALLRPGALHRRAIRNLRRPAAPRQAARDREPRIHAAAHRGSRAARARDRAVTTRSDRRRGRLRSRARLRDPSPGPGHCGVARGRGGEEKRGDFKRWSDTVVSAASGSGAGPTQMLGVFQELTSYLNEVMERRRVEPTDDLISTLVGAEEGDTLSPVEVVMFAMLLLVAGNETTTNLIGNGMLALLDHPDQLEKVREDAGLIPGFVEETRYGDLT